MKKNFILILILCSAFTSSAQVIKFKVTSVSFKNYDENTEQWENWSTPDEVDILGFIDGENNRIKIFSASVQIFDVIEYKGSFTDSDGDDIIEWVCIDENGHRCGFRLVTLNSQNSRKQLYIDYDNFLISNNIHFLE